MSRFLKHTTQNLAGQVATVSLGLANGIILARVLGPTGRGVLAGAVLIPQLLNALMASGFGTSIVYFVSSKKWSEGQAVKSVVGLNLYLITAVLITGGLSVSVGRMWLVDVPFDLLLVGLVTIPLILSSQSFACLLQGKQAFGALLRYRVAAAVLLVIATITGLMLSGGQAMGALLGRIAGTAVAIAYLCWIIRKHYPSSSWLPELRIDALKPALSYGGRAHAANAVSYLNYRADQLLVAGMIDASALGIYTVAVTWAEMLWLVAGNMSGVLLPRLASEKDAARSIELTSQLARVMLGFIVVTTILFGTIAVPLIPWIYTAAFAGAATALLALLPGIMAMGYTKVLANYMAAIGRPEINAKNATVGLFVNLVANVLLIPHWQIVGAAVATSLSYTIISCLCYRDYLRLTHSTWSEPIVIRREDAWRAISMLRGLLRPLFAKSAS